MWCRNRLLDCPCSRPSKATDPSGSSASFTVGPGVLPPNTQVFISTVNPVKIKFTIGDDGGQGFFNAKIGDQSKKSGNSEKESGKSSDKSSEKGLDKGSKKSSSKGGKG